MSWQLSRANDLPLHPVDLWAYDHRPRMPAADSIDAELARGPGPAADAFESSSRLRLDLVLGDIAARDLGEVPALVEGPQLMPGFAAPLPPGWCVWLLPDPARTRLVRDARLAKEEALAGRPAAGHSRARLIAQRDAVLTRRIRDGGTGVDRAGRARSSRSGASAAVGICQRARQCERQGRHTPRCVDRGRPVRRDALRTGNCSDAGLVLPACVDGRAWSRNRPAGSHGRGRFRACRDGVPAPCGWPRRERSGCSLPVPSRPRSRTACRPGSPYGLSPRREARWRSSLRASSTASGSSQLSFAMKTGS